MEVPQKTKNRTIIQSCFTFLGIYLKECKPGYNRDACTCMFIAALFPKYIINLDVLNI
jgi:hypothetical protein